MTLHADAPRIDLKRAIVVNSFGRSGSNILVNMIGSSPSVLMAAREFWQFYYKGRNLPPKVYRRLGIGAGRLASRSLFSPSRFRACLETCVQDSISRDYQLHRERGLDPGLADQVLFKATEYDIFLNSEIERSFDQVTFVGLVRNGYGLCDSWKRRGMPAKMAGKVYNHVAGRMMEQRSSRRNYVLVRFEDLLADPLGLLDELYARLRLPRPDDDAFIHRPKGFGPGQEEAASGARRMKRVGRAYWQTLLSENINAAAMERLTTTDFEEFNLHGGTVMEELYEIRWK